MHADDSVTGIELRKSTGAGTTLVKDINPGALHSFPEYFLVFGGTAYFRANDGTNGNELWKSDTTEGGTQLVLDIRPGAQASDPWKFTEVGSVFFFEANDGMNGHELWKSMGTAAATVMVKDIYP